MTTTQTQIGIADIRGTTTQNQMGLAYIIVDILLQRRKFNFQSYQGATFNVDIPVYNWEGSIFNLTGYTVSGWMSRSYFSSKPNIQLQVAITQPTQGIINWTISDDDTTLMYPDNYVFNIDVSNGGNNLRILQGVLSLEPGVNLKQVIRCKTICGIAWIGGQPGDID